MDPLSVHKELVLVLSFWQVQDRYKVIMALERVKQTRISLQNTGFFQLVKSNPLACLVTAGMASPVHVTRVSMCKYLDLLELKQILCTSC